MHEGGKRRAVNRKAPPMHFALINDDGTDATASVPHSQRSGWSNGAAPHGAKLEQRRFRPALDGQ